MELRFGWRRKQEDTIVPVSVQEVLMEEIWKAHGEWVIAQHRFDWVLENDQIDYAVYALEAAEKKYEMLLRQAKKMSLVASPGIWSEA